MPDGDSGGKWVGNLWKKRYSRAAIVLPSVTVFGRHSSLNPSFSIYRCGQDMTTTRVLPKMSDRASNNVTPPTISQTPPPIEVVISQPPIIAISPGEWTELAAVVEHKVRDQSILIYS